MAGCIREITVGDQAIVFEINGATFVLYQQAFKRDGLAALTALEENPMDALGLVQEFAYIMCGAYEKGVPYIKWLAQFDVMDLPNASEAIMGLLYDSMTTNDTGTPKNAEAETEE